jgi:hypothetical protein
VSPFLAGLATMTLAAASDAPPDAPVATPSPEAPAEPPTARRVPLRWQGRAPPPEADFRIGDVEVDLRLGFNGTSPNPFTLLTALAGWNELALSVDCGVAAFRDFTIGVGGEIHHGQSLVLGAVSAPIANYDDYQFRWAMSASGATVRVTAHDTSLQGIDPYLFAAVGASAFRIEAGLVGTDVPPRDHVSAAVRLEVGGGLRWRIGVKGWIVGLELRYLFTADTSPVDRFLFDDDGASAVFAFADLHQPPKGFSWVVHAGYRF